MKIIIIFRIEKVQVHKKWWGTNTHDNLTHYLILCKEVMCWPHLVIKEKWSCSHRKKSIHLFMIMHIYNHFYTNLCQISYRSNAIKFQHKTLLLYEFLSTLNLYKVRTFYNWIKQCVFFCYLAWLFVRLMFLYVNIAQEDVGGW